MDALPVSVTVETETKIARAATAAATAKRTATSATRKSGTTGNETDRFSLCFSLSPPLAFLLCPFPFVVGSRQHQITPHYTTPHFNQNHRHRQSRWYSQCEFDRTPGTTRCGNETFGSVLRLWLPLFVWVPFSHQSRLFLTSHSHPCCFLFTFPSVSTSFHP